MNRRRVALHVAVLAAGLASLAVLAAGCGGKSTKSPPVASRAPTTSSGTASNSNPSTASSSPKSVLAQLLEFAECMRSHDDPDYPDPVIGSNGQPHLGGTPQQYKAATPQFEAAKEACYKYTPAGSETPAEKTTALVEAVKFAECMRSRGEPSFPDPTSSGEFNFSAQDNINSSSPQFQAAQKTCQSLDPGLQLPVSGGGGGSP